MITIDGPAASGKGTLARRLAWHLGLRHLDSGLLYRATALRLRCAGEGATNVTAAVAAAAAVTEADLTDAALRQPAISGLASEVAAIPAVRTAVLALQRAVASTPPGAVIDGRDIGTVVCPDATVKLFLDARPDVRAARRAADHPDSDPATVAAELAERDRRDTVRAVAPLAVAPDATVIDTSALDAEAVFAVALAVVRRKAGLEP